MNQSHEAQIHYIVSFIGGFLGIFPIVNASHFLGSAQTSNLIDILLGFIYGNGRSVLFHAGGAFLYAFAVFLVTFLPKHTKLNIKILAMIVDVAAGFAMWLFPVEKNFRSRFISTRHFLRWPFSGARLKELMVFQVPRFFSSNNFRQFIASLTEIYCNGDKSFSLKARFFCLTLLCFHLGLTVGWIFWHFLGNAGFLFVIVPAATVVCGILKK